LFVILSVVLSLSLCRCSTAPVTPPAPSGPVSLKSLTKNIDTEWDMIAQIAVLNADEHTARLRIDSDVVLFDDHLVRLSDEVKMIDSEVIVPPDFYDKVIQPLTVPAKRFSITKKERMIRVREIVIDAGHGGKDPGAISSSNLKEKDVVLDIAKKTAALLRKDGIKVRMTRDRDEFITLERRTEIASKQQVDMFISIHANANKTRSISGLEVYVLRPQGRDFKEKQIQKNYHHLFSELKMESKGDVSQIIGDMLDQRKSAASERLADIIGKQIARSAKAQNRGVREAGFFVLRNTIIPAVLIEVGYLTNPREAALLEDSSYREKIAKGIAKGIISYLNEKN
jgi:N-acetylmuramoyl-L-alanine amidase